MVQFWTHKEVTFVHYCVLQFAYCAVVIAEDFDAVEVCYIGLKCNKDEYIRFFYIFM